MTKVAVIGAGAISSSHIEAYLTFPDRVQIVAVADVYPEKAEQQIFRYHLTARALKDYQDLLDDPEIQLVSVCTPPGTHKEITCACLKAGKHVLVEKPMAASLAECDEMIRAADESGKVLSVVAQNRFRTPMMKLKQVLEAGVAGKVLHAQVDSHWWRGHSYYDLWWRGTWASEGGGCTLNHAVHHIDALQWMMGMPTQVTAIMANLAHDNAEVEDISLALLRFGNGSLAQITSSVVHHGQEQQLVFQAEKAMVAMPWRLYASVSRENGFPERASDVEAEIQSFYDSLPEVRYEAHTGQIDNVLTAIETGQPVLIDGMQGRRTLELITAIYKSAITSQPVSLPLTQDDEFYTRDGLLARAPHFYEKTSSVVSFADNEITTSGTYGRNA
ncbi:MAG: Gfo/Idh/MocA family oxidoreductase [Alicyclobacillus herbarius]|uniref:Gfo/Idh/MocA family protein n=1 Tax=Alicyclobacillus herbarius TaxID=122960 RepID=UPI002353F432|nr:Gfo/Idh/MocA family oxidoreductase [Alicyclobacillus herbarius]MCL6632423.1 Gfo/Idh/MocA family oxidoreductase [Alicyclobacillus herbarius]